jgi:hypothetical protein
VPISEALRDRCADPDFWAAYLTADGGPGADGGRSAGGDATRGGGPGVGDGADELRVTFPVAGGYGLVLDLELTGGGHCLSLRQPTASEPVHLAGAGPGRPMPAVLRCAELDLIGRVLALDDPTLPHPGLPVALLAPFAPITTDDDPRLAGALLGAAYRSLRREVTPVAAVLPEQPPLPLFAADQWWPRPEQPSDRVLTDDDIAYLLDPPACTPAAVRGGARFPATGLAELVRQAGIRLARLRQADWYTTASLLPLARRICVSGDLSGVPALAAALERAGCDHPTVLDALTGPVVALEAGWVVETLAGVQPGSLVSALANP